MYRRPATDLNFQEDCIGKFLGSDKCNHPLVQGSKIHADIVQKILLVQKNLTLLFAKVTVVAPRGWTVAAIVFAQICEFKTRKKIPCCTYVMILL
jgi:hypothetical protein